MEVAPVIALLPHHLLVACDHAAGIVSSCGLNRAILPRRGDGCASELDANGTLASLGVVVLGSEPRKVGNLEQVLANSGGLLLRTPFETYPVPVAVSSKEDVIPDPVVIQVLQSPVSVRDVTLYRLSIILKLGGGAEVTHVPVILAHDALVVLIDTREGDLVADNSPGSPTLV